MDFASSTRQLTTGQDGKGLLRIHLRCPDDLPRLCDRIEIDIESSAYKNILMYVHKSRLNSKIVSPQIFDFLISLIRFFDMLKSNK